MNKNFYDDKSIESLSPLEFTRLRPGVYCGDTSFSTQLVVELVSNAIDEFQLGHGTKINIETKKEGSLLNFKGFLITVEDEGQGFIPNSMREDGKTVLEASFSVLNTSGKYKEDGVYEGTSLGSFGIGSKLATYLSHALKVSSWRDGTKETIYFKEGEFLKREVTSVKKGESGTKVEFIPSEEFFGSPEVEDSKIRKLFSEVVCLCVGLEINYNGTKFFSQKGLDDLVDKKIGNNEIIVNRLRISAQEGKSKLNLCLTYGSNYSATITPYVNLGLTEAGPHITTFKTVLTKEINKYAKDNGLLTKDAKNFVGEDIQEGLCCIFNLTHPSVAYDAQVKSRITSKDFNSFLSKTISEHLRIWFKTYPKQIELIITKALSARKAREAAKKARDTARKTIETKAQVLKVPEKLADCSSKKRKECEIFIVEGKTNRIALSL